MNRRNAIEELYLELKIFKMNVACVDSDNYSDNSCACADGFGCTGANGTTSLNNVGGS